MASLSHTYHLKWQGQLIVRSIYAIVAKASHKVKTKQGNNTLVNHDINGSRISQKRGKILLSITDCYSQKTDQGDDSLHLLQGCWQKRAKNSIL